jgi:hypothetical protein
LSAMSIPLKSCHAEDRHVPLAAESTETGEASKE